MSDCIPYLVFSLIKSGIRMELSKLNENKACLSGKKDNKHVDHITDIIGIFGPFHAVFYTAIGTVYILGQ